MRIRLIASLSLLVLSSSAAVMGCSSDDPPAAAPAPVASPPVGTRIAAAAGGKVSDSAGKVTLSIPAGALAADTEITVAVIAPSNGSVSDVYELGPDGLQFAKPVAIEIKGDKALAPAGKTLALAVFEGGAFKPLADSAFDGTKATATITHFSRYALVIVDGQAILKPPASCDEAYAQFKACGGDLKGTWNFSEFCLPEQAIGTDPPIPNCPEATLEGDFDLSAWDVVIDATSIKILAGNIKLINVTNYPLVCSNRGPDGATAGAPIPDCPTLQAKIFKKATCVDKGSGVCQCTEVQDLPQEEQVSTYTTSGNTITSTDDKGKVTTSEYCVSGAVATSRAPDADGKKGGYYSLQRK